MNIHTTRTWIGLACMAVALALGSCQARGSAPANDPDVLIGMERGPCFGTCPIYAVTIDGDGNVTYSGQNFVAVTGVHKDKISKEAVQHLLDLFKSADFFSLLDEYRAEVTDNPTMTVALKIGDRSKRVVDYVGQMAGMPASVTSIETQIDMTVAIEKWTKAGPGLVPALKGQGFDFKTAAAADLLAAAARYGQQQTVVDFLTEGTPVTGTNAGVSTIAYGAASGNTVIVEGLLAAGAGETDKQQLTDALWFAASSGNATLVKRFIELGGDAKGNSTQSASERGAPSSDGTPVLFAATASCDAAVVDEVLKHKPDVTATDSSGRTAVFNLVDRGKCAMEDRKDDARSILKALKRAGAKLDVHDSNGSSPLMSTYSEDMVRALLEAGANVNFRNSNGDTALLSTYSEDIALILLKAGADRSQRNAAGQTILDRAQQNNWPKVIAELSKG